MKSHILAVGSAIAVAAIVGVAVAKLPAPPPMTDEQKAKAEAAAVAKKEAAAKEAELLNKAMDRAVENYKKSKGMAMAPAAPPAPAKGAPAAAKK